MSMRPIALLHPIIIKRYSIYNEFLILITVELSNKFAIQLFLCSLISNNLEANLEPWIRTLKEKQEKRNTHQD